MCVNQPQQLHRTPRTLVSILHDVQSGQHEQQRSGMPGMSGIRHGPYDNSVYDTRTPAGSTISAKSPDMSDADATCMH